MAQMSFSGSEVVEIGIQIEKNGRDFYSALIETAKAPGTKKLFRSLADDEARHIIDFEHILASVQRYEPKESYPQEYFAYMHAIASGYVFTKKDKGTEIAKRIKTETEALDMGIGFEKDSILLYEAMKKVVPKDDVPVIEKLMKEEQGHLIALQDIRNKTQA